VDAAVAKETAKRFPAVQDLFSIRDLGGWAQVEKTLFAPDGVYERAMAAAR
jgi:sulfate transport system substrate-binding protein